MADLTADLLPMLDRMLQVRAAAGHPLEEIVPVFHATDSYRKHRLELMSFYKDYFLTAQLRASYSTPRADADAIRADRYQDSPVPFYLKITGDPMHDVFNLRRLAKPQANDYSNFCFDHMDVLLRLSAPARPPEPRVQPTHGLGAAALYLLEVGVTKSNAYFKSAVSINKVAAEALRTFISQPFASEHPLWVDKWGTPLP